MHWIKFTSEVLSMNGLLKKAVCDPLSPPVQRNLLLRHKYPIKQMTIVHSPVKSDQPSAGPLHRQSRCIAEMKKSGEGG